VADAFAYARYLASRTDLNIVWVTTLPIAFAIRRPRR
jgi:hypothetical protein